METCQVCRGHGYLPPERECANDNCRRLFRWQEGRSASGRARVDAIYCSPRCGKAQLERKRRASQRKPQIAPPPSPSPERGIQALLLPIPDARKALGGIGHTKIYELIGTGQLRTVKIGRRTFVPTSAVDEYVAQLI